MFTLLTYLLTLITFYWARLPVKALFYFPKEHKTSIAPTHITVEKVVNIDKGKMVTING